MGLDITAYVDWIRVERRLSSSLRSLGKMGFCGSGSAGREKRARGSGINANWKTELANGQDG